VPQRWRIPPVSAVGPRFLDRDRPHGDGCMEPDLREGHDVRRLTPLRGTWLAVAIMSPILIAQIALALPDLFVEDAPDEAVTTSYGSTSDVFTSSTTTPGPTETIGPTAKGPTSQTNIQLDALQPPEVTDGPDGDCPTDPDTRSDLDTGKAQGPTGETECPEGDASDEHDSSEVSKESVTKSSESQDASDNDHDESDGSKKSKNPKESKKSKKSDKESDSSDNEHDKSDD